MEDQAHIQYLLKKAWNFLDIADQMTHYMLTLLRDEIVTRHPEWNKEQIRDEMRKKLLEQKQMKMRGK